VGLQIYPVLTALADEYLARKQFPVLSGFETPWELARWDGTAGMAIDSSVHLSGRRSLRVLLGTEPYSGIYMEYFPKNWRGAKSFRFSVFNPSQQEISLKCKIYDLKHEKHWWRYSDRYNHRYELRPGWTTIEIDARDIHNAPRGRRMDMANITGLGMYTIRLKRPRVIYIDDVRFVN
jgi:hypothetical protein